MRAGLAPREQGALEHGPAQEPSSDAASRGKQQQAAAAGNLATHTALHTQETQTEKVTMTMRVL